MSKRIGTADKDEFYQLLTYTDDVDLNKKLDKWKTFIILIDLILVPVLLLIRENN